MSRPGYWQPNRIGVMLAAIAALLASFTPIGPRIEALLLDVGNRFAPQAVAGKSVSVVAIDAATLDARGPWPWSRSALADVIDRLAHFQPRAIGFMFALQTRETPGNLDRLRDGLDSLDASLRPRAAAWLQQLDSDARLQTAISAAGNVILAVPYAAGPVHSPPPESLQRFTLQTPAPPSSRLQRTQQLLWSRGPANNIDSETPLPLFLDGAAGIGMVAPYSEGQRVRGAPLLIDTGEQLLPGMALSLMAAARGIDAAVFISASASVSIEAGHYPHAAAPPTVISLQDVMASDRPARSLRDRVVLLGLTAPGVAPVITGPGDYIFTPVTWTARVLDSLLENDGFLIPAWFHAAQRGLLVVFALYLLLLPQGWHDRRGLLLCVLLAAVVLNAGVITLIVRNQWIPVVGPACFLLLTQMLMFIAHRRRSVLAAARQATVQARLALGNNLQSQGQLEAAMQQFAHCLPDRAAFEPLYELGLEYERRRQVGKARRAYEQLGCATDGFRDAAQRLARLSELSDRFPSTRSTGTDSTLVLDAPVMELPVLGRYRLERELGRGGMGTVYLASDPTISRKLAIKTLPLAQAYEDREQEAIAERFFREAEAVGRLNHPNIVAIHDAGREHDLAYIAMDYAPGRSLEAWTTAGDLLPVWEALDIAAQVADALAYAHGHNVVHRDIKPGNLIYDRDSGLVKITDFGVARILDASRTRTGTVLGTPSYMSPEQVAGRKTDGRSDLFSLGTTLYQLLTGSLPFEGDSVATLMYQIANQKTPAVRKLRRGLPLCVARLTGKALQKEPARRFVNGEAMAIAIRNCRAQFKGGRRKTA